jgi:hypothetical protein
MPVAAPLAGGALTTLAALSTALNSIDTSTVVGRSTLPILQFKREDNGSWSYGQRRTVVEDGSHWAPNPMSFRWGYICFNDANKVIGEHLVNVAKPKPDLTTLPDKGFEWSEQWAVNMKCISGADAGVEVAFKPTTVGGIQFVAGLIEAVRDRLNSGQHDNKIVPIVLLQKDSYQHAQYGRVWTPQFAIVDWMSLSGPAPAPEPAAPPSAPLPANSNTAPPGQPRRRRVG